jgi:hypothetical protein
LRVGCALESGAELCHIGTDGGVKRGDIWYHPVQPPSPSLGDIPCGGDNFGPRLFETGMPMREVITVIDSVRGFQTDCARAD